MSGRIVDYVDEITLALSWLLPTVFIRSEMILEKVSDQDDLDAKSSSLPFAPVHVGDFVGKT